MALSGEREAGFWLAAGVRGLAPIQERGEEEQYMVISHKGSEEHLSLIFSPRSNNQNQKEPWHRQDISRTIVVLSRRSEEAVLFMGFAPSCIHTHAVGDVEGRTMHLLGRRW